MNGGIFWERLEGEPDTAYQAFCAYRDMGIARSLRKAAAAFYAEHEGHQRGPEGTPNPNSNPAALRRFKAWSSAWLWVARCEAFDAEEARERSIRLQERRLKMSEFHYNLGALALQRIAERLRGMAMDEPIPKSLAPLLNAAANLQRLSVGESTVVADVRAPTRHPEEREADREWLDRLSVEEKEELCKLAGYLPAEDYDLEDLDLHGDPSPAS